MILSCLKFEELSTEAQCLATVDERKLAALDELKKSLLHQAFTGQLKEHTMKKENKLQIRNSTAEFLIFTRQAGEDGIEVRVADETVWLTQKLMAALFAVTVPTINEHLANLYSQGEIVKGSTIRNFRTVQKEGGREVARAVEFYNLDATGAPPPN